MSAVHLDRMKLLTRISSALHLVGICRDANFTKRPVAVVGCAEGRSASIATDAHRKLSSILRFTVCTAACGLLYSVASFSVHASDAQQLSYEGSTFDVYRLDADEVPKLRFYWKDENGEPYKTIGRLRLSLDEQGKKLLFATNGGIYSKEYTPLGLYVEQGKKLGSLNMGQGSGNFSMKPNAVFYMDNSGAHIENSVKLSVAIEKMQNAVQSGPALLLDGMMHPRFFKESDSYNIRNGVGIDSKGGVVFAISNTPVNFYTFAALFRDKLDCDNALYLDGSISEMYLPALERTFTFRFFTTIFGVAE